MAENFEGRTGCTVYVKNGNVTRAWRKLKRVVQDEGIMQELRKRQFYEKPSARKRRERAMARKRHLKAQAERDI